MKQVTAQVLFSDALVKVLNVNEYKLGGNTSNVSNVGVVIEIGPSAVLSRVAKSWWEPNFGEKSPVWVTSLENPDIIKDIWYQVFRIQSIVFKSHL